MNIEYFSEEGYFLTRLCFQRGLAFIYIIGFLNIINQWPALLGSAGLLPANRLISQTNFLENPSIFYLNASDRIFLLFAIIGLALAIFALSGVSERYGYVLSMSTWFLLWVIYLSFVNVGRTWYSFGWESMLLEVGFLAIFFGPNDVKPSLIVIWLLRWVLFRNMFGAGMIKLRGDPCWRDLTCLYYYYETQPMPNPLSIYFHYLPKVINKACVVFNHFAELVVPFFYFAPASMAVAAGVLTITFQSSLIITGNLSFLNYLSIVMAIPCFNDGILKKILWIDISAVNKIPLWHSLLLYALLALILFLSLKPIKNLLSSSQIMNTSFDRLHLVNTYGAFGSITRKRYEIIIEGTLDDDIDAATTWREYEFKGKPGRVDKTPRVIAPYHLRLDWLMWFAAMDSYEYHPWLLNLATHLLKADKKTLALLDHDPFNGKTPKFLRMKRYEYKFERPFSKNVWHRRYAGEYMPTVFMQNGQLRAKD